MIMTTKITKAAAAIILVIMAYILLINILGYCGLFGTDVVAVGWESMYGNSHILSYYPLRVYLALPYMTMFPLLLIMFIIGLKANTVKWVWTTAIVLLCIGILPFWLEAQTGMYVVTCFRGDEMIRPLEDYWLTTGMNEHPFMGFLVTAGESVDLFYRLGCLVPVAFAMVFASLLSVDKIAGITGVVTMAASLLIEIAGFQYGIIAYNLCWIVLAAVMLWRMQTINK